MHSQVLYISVSELFHVCISCLELPFNKHACKSIKVKDKVDLLSRGVLENGIHANKLWRLSHHFHILG